MSVAWWMCVVICCCCRFCWLFFISIHNVSKCLFLTMHNEWWNFEICNVCILNVRIYDVRMRMRLWLRMVKCKYQTESYASMCKKFERNQRTNKSSLFRNLVNFMLCSSGPWNLFSVFFSYHSFIHSHLSFQHVIQYANTLHIRNTKNIYIHIISYKNNNQMICIADIKSEWGKTQKHKHALSQ